MERRTSRLSAGGLAFAFVAPAAAALISALRRPWLPVSDWALIELRVRNVGTARTPLLGAYSRYGWDHPGPWPFYLLAVPYRLVGAAHGLLTGAGLWNVAALTALAWLLVRRDLLLAVVALPVMAVLVRGLGAGFLNDPWNPSLPVLPLAVLVPVALSYAEGRRWAAPVLAGLASLIVQAHVGFTPVVGAIGGAAVASRLWRRFRPITEPEPSVTQPRSGRFAKRGTTAAVTGVVLLIAWAPPLLDQAVHRPGNLSKLVQSSVEPTKDLPPAERRAAGPRTATRLFARQFGVPAPWLGARESKQYFDVDSVAGRGRAGDLLPLFGVSALGAAVAVRRRDRAAVTLLMLCGAGAAGAWVGLASIRGEPYQWLVRWCWPVAAWTWAAALWALARALVAWLAVRDERESPAFERWSVVVATATTAVLAVLTIGRTTMGHRPQGELSTAMGRLAPAVTQANRGSHGVFLLAVPNTAPETFSLALALDRAGQRWTFDLDKAERERFASTLGVELSETNEPTGRRGPTREVLATTPSRLTTPLSPKVVKVVRSPFDIDGLRFLLGEGKPPPM